jgi:hypothetical protein
MDKIIHEFLASNEKDVDIYKVEEWIKSDLLAKYKELFRLLGVSLIERFHHGSDVWVENDSEYKLKIVAFEGQFTASLNLRIKHVKGFDLLGIIEIQINKGERIEKFIKCPFNKLGYLLGLDGKPLENVNGTIIENVPLILGTLIKESMTEAY